MFIYKDYNYVNYILDLSYIEGIKIYTKCIDRFNNIEEEKIDNRQWELYLLACQHGAFEGNFEDYKKQNQIQAENKTMTDKEAKEEFDRINKNASKIIELSKRMNKNEKIK
jgi:hypothetical protein